MAQLGADDVQVDRLAATFDRTAARLTTSEQTISTSVQSVTWLGPDADAFRTTWKTGMKAQLSTVSERLTALAKDLRSQAEAQRRTSAGTDIPTTPSPFERFLDNARDWVADRIEAMERIAALDEWADDEGRQQIRDMADERLKDQLSWWKGLSDEQQQALLRNDPGALFGLDGLPASVRAEARAAYLESVAGDIELSSSEDKIEGELTIAWLHLGVEGTAAIVQVADGTYRVDLALDGEIGANIGSGQANGNVSLGAGIAQSYEFDSLEDAEAFVDGLYGKLTPDPDWSWLGGPGAVVTETVDEVVGYLGDHSDQRTSFQGEVNVNGEVDLELGAFNVNMSGEAGARYDFDTDETTLFVGTAFSGEYALASVAPVDGAGQTATFGLSADVEAAVTFDDNSQISEITLSGTLGAEASVGLEQFLAGTNADSATPQSMSMSLNGAGEVSFNASLDLQDPIVQQQVAELLNGLGNGDVSFEQLQGVLAESELQVQVNAVSTNEVFDLDVGVAALNIAGTNTANVVTWVKPPGGDFTHVSAGELTGGRR